TIRLTKGNIVKVLYKNSAMDVSVCFAEIAWSGDSRRVGILVQNCYGPTPIIVGYDVVSDHSVETRNVEEGLRIQIQANYPEWRDYDWGRPYKRVEDPDAL